MHVRTPDFTVVTAFDS